VLYGTLDIRPGFDMALKEPMMLDFVATIGLGADLKLLKQAGPRPLPFAMICLACLIFQDGIGVLTAMGLDLHPLVGADRSSCRAGTVPAWCTSSGSPMSTTSPGPWPAPLSAWSWEAGSAAPWRAG